MIRISPAFLAANPEIHFVLGSRRQEIEPGWHFGSRYPGDPARIAVYDFLPDALLPTVVNLEDFRAILVFDKWGGNADGRQSVFYRAMVRRGPGRPKPGFVASMIDHGFAFDGPNWDFPDSPLQGLYPRRIVYHGVRSLDDFQPWLDLMLHFPEEVIDQAWKRIPPEWLEGDEESLERLLQRFTSGAVASPACSKPAGRPAPRRLPIGVPRKANTRERMCVPDCRLHHGGLTDHKRRWSAPPG